MLKLFMIADDITGALDSGVKFAEYGLKISVIPSIQGLRAVSEKDAEVVVVNSDSRRMSPEEAYKTLYEIGKIAKEFNPQIIYKKVDSALRGNIGSEFQALIDVGLGESVNFIPAYPEMNRVTVNGILYIDGVPVAESVFAEDPFNPITSSYVHDIIARQSALRTRLVKRGTPLDDRIFRDKRAINIYDVQTNEDMRNIATQLWIKGHMQLLSGCAGFAEVMARLLGRDKQKTSELPDLQKEIIICGSLNPISLNQIAYATNKGMTNMHIPEECEMDAAYWDTEEGRAFVKNIREEAKNKLVIIDTLNQEGGYDKKIKKDKNKLIYQEAIMQTLGVLIQRLITYEKDCLFLITGGDTLMGFVRLEEEVRFIPIFEVVKGVVLSRMESRKRSAYILSKSGGFCREDIFIDIFNKLIKKNKRGYM